MALLVIYDSSTEFKFRIISKLGTIDFPESITYFKFGMVMEVSAMFVEKNTVPTFIICCC